jgi:hypothetical protein
MLPGTYQYIYYIELNSPSYFRVPFLFIWVFFHYWNVNSVMTGAIFVWLIFVNPMSSTAQNWADNIMDIHINLWNMINRFYNRNMFTIHYGVK